MSLAQQLPTVVDIAQGAAGIIMDHYGRVERLTKTHEATTDEAVTEADRASQRYIVQRLREAFPGDGFVGEESDCGTSITFECPDPGGRVWVIDPIDGTNNFVAGHGAFAVCIGLLDQGMPVLGVVLDVTRGLVYAAARGHGAYAGARRVDVTHRPLDEATLIMLTSNLLIDGKLPGFVTRWLGQTTWKIRILGSAALEAAAVATGAAHAAVTVHGKIWDLAAPAALVLEAGGIITDLRGQAIFPFDLAHYKGTKVPFLACAPHVHKDLLRGIDAGA
jgi:myo-inositol-1(or 4)-monophosphatase